MEPTQITHYTKSMTTKNREDSSQTNKEVNSGQNFGDNNVPFHKNTMENGQGSDTHIRTRYGRIV